MRASTKRFRVTPDGRVPQDVADHLRDWLLMHRGREVEVRLRQAPRSLASNRYYWGVVIGTIRRALAGAGQAMTAEQLHEIFKRRYLEPRANADRTLPPSTTGLDAFEFHRFVEAVRHDEDVLRLGVHIPEPDGVEGHTIIEVERAVTPENPRRTPRQ